MEMTVKILLCLTVFQSAASLEGILPALRYFKARNIGSMNVLLCEGYGKTHLGSPDLMGIAWNLKFSKSIRRETLNFIFEKPPSQVIGVALSLDCPGSWEILQWISQYRSFKGSFVYGLITRSSINDTLMSMNRLEITFDSDVVVLCRRRIYDVYRTAKGEQLISVEVGRWNDTGVVLSGTRRRWDLHGVTLKACTVLKEFPKKLFMKKEFYDHDYVPYMDALTRFPCRQHRSIEHLMNFKTNLTLVPDWGYWDEVHRRFDKGSMYGSLQDGEYEFGLTLSWMYSERMQSAFFAPVTHPLKSGVVFRHPPAGATVTAFARPFTWGTWLAIFSFIATGSLCLHVIMMFLEYDSPFGEGEIRFSNSLFHIAGAICLKSSYVNPVKIPTRMVALIFQIMALMVYSYYGATILGFLLSPSPRTITTVEKLLDSDMQLWAENLSFHRQHFMAGVSSKATKFYNKAIKGPTKNQDRFISLIVGLEMVQKGGTALYGLTPNLYENVQKLYSTSEMCSLYFMDLLAISTATPIQKKSPYREVYFKAVSWMIESGLNNYEEKHWHAQKPQCVGTEDNVAVKLEATLIAQILYATGFLMALVIFTIEKSVASNKRGARHGSN